MPRGNFSSMFGALQNLPPSRFTPQLSPFQADVMARLADVGLGGNMPIIPPTTPTMTAPMLPGGLGPLDFQTQEPVPPPLPQQPNLDEIRARYMAIAGPPPVAPTIHPASKLEQIAAILSGVSYGQRGQGAEYLAGLREQKEKPQREYQAKQDAYQNILRSLALTGEEAATRAQEGYQRTTQGLLNQRYEREVSKADAANKEQAAERLARLHARLDQAKSVAVAETRGRYTLLGDQLKAQDRLLGEAFKDADDLIHGGADANRAFDLAEKRRTGTLTPKESGEYSKYIRNYTTILHPPRKTGEGGPATPKALTPEGELTRRLSLNQSMARTLQNKKLIEVTDANGQTRVIEAPSGMIDPFSGRVRGIPGAKATRELSPTERSQYAQQQAAQSNQAAVDDYQATKGAAGVKRSERPVQVKKQETATMDEVRAVARQMNKDEQWVINYFKSKGIQVTQ